MIWFILVLLTLFAVAFTMAPLRRNEDAEPLAELQQLRDQITKIRAETYGEGDSSENAILELEKRALSLLNSQPQKSDSSHSSIRILVPVFFIVGVVGFYNSLGSPRFDETSISLAQLNIETAGNVPLDILVERLQVRLKSDPNPPPLGYQLLGRSLMQLGRHKEAIEAYKAAIDLSGGDPTIQDELNRAQSHINNLSRPALTADVVDSFSQLSENERQDMNAGMVDRLSMRLRDNPEDIQGWERLLRSRLVLDQKATANEELLWGLRALLELPDKQQELKRTAQSLGFDVQE